MTKIKFCGMLKEKDVRGANDALPDYVGFMFSDSDKRHVSEQTAKSLRSILNGNIIPVGIFEDQPIDYVLRMLKENVIEAAQLQGHEDEEYIKELHSKTDKLIIKEFHVKGIEDIKAAEVSSANLILIDGEHEGDPLSDPDLLKDIKRDYILAGGLTPENVVEAIAKFHPYGVDADSGIEDGPFKDPKKMTDFIQAVKKADGQ